MASVASDSKQKCVAAVLHLEDVQKEMTLLDHATGAADERILLALLGTLYFAHKLQLVLFYRMSIEWLHQINYNYV
jgi:hypothetical protein